MLSVVRLKVFMAGIRRVLPLDLNTEKEMGLICLYPKGLSTIFMILFKGQSQSPMAGLLTSSLASKSARTSSLEVMAR